MRPRKCPRIGSAPSVWECRSKGCGLVLVTIGPSATYGISTVGSGQNPNTTMTDQLPPPQERLQGLLEQIAQLDFCLPGSLATRQLRCGNPRCRCKADPPQLHGPYTYWTRKERGRTVARLLSAEQAERYQPWLQNA